jgi:type IV secretion system protein VirB4
MLALKQFRSKAAGLPDLLNYAALMDEGIVQGKDGSLMAGFWFRGDDAAVSTDAERNYITAMINGRLARFGAGWAMWVDAIRADSPGYPAPSESHFPDPITALIDAERRAMFEQDNAHFESDYGIVIQYLPPLNRESKLSDMLYDDDGRDTSKSPGDRHLIEFKKRMSDLEDGLADLIHLKRMKTLRAVSPDGDEYDSDELVNYLHFCLTGKPIALRIPDCPMYLDAWLGTPELWPGDTPKLGNQFIATVAVEGFPSTTFPGILDMLDGLPLQYRWSSRFIFLEKLEAEAAINRFKLKWQQKIRGFWSQIMKSNKGTVNTDALTMSQDAEAALNEVRSDLVAYGYYTPVVVLMHDNREFLTEQARYVAREIERRGFATRIESVNCMEAWLGSLPGHTYPNVRRPLIHTLNLADMLPLSSVWAGLARNPCDKYPANSPPLMQTVTTGATPFRLNLHVSDVGHTLIFGPTGAGKSTILATLHAQFRRYHSRPLPDGSTLPAQIFAFDKARSLYALCTATKGGTHYDIGADDSTATFAPLADLDSDSDILWAEEWVAICFELQAQKPPNPHQKGEIHRAMLLLAAAPKEYRSLTDFVTTVQDDEIRAALSHYTISGPMGHLLDGRSNSISITPYTVFEIDDLMKLGDSNVLPCLLVSFRLFEKGLTGQPAMLSLDEAWVVLGHPVFKAYLRKWLKELRKANCSVVLATQSLSDAVNSGLLDVLLEQCPTKILLPNSEADLEGTDDTPGPAKLYRTFGLNDKEIALLKNSQYKRHYYYKSPLGRRRFELGLGPLALSFVAVSDKESLAEIKNLQATHGENWPLRWLDKRGVNYEQYLAH